MRFIKFSEDLIYSICEFCEKQGYDSHYEDFDLLGILYAAADELYKVKGVLPVSEIHRYHVSGDEAEYILPESVENNGVIYKNAVLLGTFINSEYDEDEIPCHEITAGHDVIYDIDDKTVKLLYRVEITNDIGSTLYRVEDDNFEGFEPAEFIVSLSLQIADRLRNGGEWLGKVCDIPCA